MGWFNGLLILMFLPAWLSRRRERPRHQLRVGRGSPGPGRPPGRRRGPPGPRGWLPHRPCSSPRRSTTGSGTSPSTGSTSCRNSSSKDGRTSSSATSSPSRAGTSPDDVVNYYVRMLSNPDALRGRVPHRHRVRRLRCRRGPGHQTARRRAGHRRPCRRHHRPDAPRARNHDVAGRTQLVGPRPPPSSPPAIRAPRSAVDTGHHAAPDPHRPSAGGRADVEAEPVGAGAGTMSQ
jgi:hypothetical protein